MTKISPPVIYYHSVAPRLFESWCLQWLTLRLPFFTDQMASLQRQGYQSLFLEEWHALRQGEKQTSGPAVCLTFDDGLLDNWVYAYPIAKKYGMRFTLFVSPDCVDPRDLVRPTLEDVWAGRCRETDLTGLGYATWPELRNMQESGVVDVQSHTMTHAKYISGPSVRSFYYGGHTGMHAILNSRPDLRPFYLTDPEFETYLPWGTPLFEESSAVVARRHFINEPFVEEVLLLARTHDLKDPDRRLAFEAEARAIHQDYQEKEELVTAIEPEADYLARLRHEIVDSKKIIEEKLGKPVRFLCWPHGENNARAHTIAREAGYLATTSGKMHGESEQPDRIPRFGAGSVRDHRWLSRRKFHYKIASHYRQQPYYALTVANDLKNKLLRKS